MDRLSRLRGYASLMREKESLHQMKRTRRRNYFAIKQYPSRPVLRKALMLVLGATLLIGTGKLIGYWTDYFSSRQTSMALREAYYAQEAPSPEAASPAASSPSDTPTPEPTSLLTDATAAPAAAATADPVTDAETGAAYLPKVPYPDNPHGIISSRFAKIRQQNSDIIGWLTIPGLLDEGVVQRDNQYYLKRDYLGYHNTNGAIFLEQSCSLLSRPYTLILYGHNMKTGAMFGSLRNYENTTFYHNNAFITFDTGYEDGRYVIFAVATVSIASTDWDYLNLTGLSSSVTASRQAALRQLMMQSVYSNTISVAVDDQLLLLVTCTAEDSERRVIAARRIRADEEETALQQLVSQSIRKSAN